MPTQNITTLTSTLTNRVVQRIKLRYRRVLLPAIIFVLLLQPSTREIVEGVLADAFIQVSSFVAFTLALYYGITQLLQKYNFSRVIKSTPTTELLFAAFLGALPGCGGAIVVMTQFTKGKISFGAVVTVLTATMGDAAFLLLAQKPLDGLLVMGISSIAGISSGFIVNKIHAADFMRPKNDTPKHISEDTNSQPTSSRISIMLVEKLSLSFWKILLIPAVFLGVLASFQMNIDQELSLPPGTSTLFGAIAGFTAILLWSLSSTGDSYEKITSEESKTSQTGWMSKVAMDTQFVTSWVVAAFLVYEISTYWFGIDFATSIQGWGSLVVLFTVLIGFLPGCGPQILVTSLYLQGSIPFSAQLSNAISNDGDALFPAIALAPKAALIATVYSAIPALVIGYGYYLLFEM